MDSRIQVQLEEDGGGSKKELEDGDKWSVDYFPPGMTSQISQVKLAYKLM